MMRLHAGFWRAKERGTQGQRAEEGKTPRTGTSGSPEALQFPNPGTDGPEIIPLKPNRENGKASSLRLHRRDTPLHKDSRRQN